MLQLATGQHGNLTTAWVYWVGAVPIPLRPPFEGLFHPSWVLAVWVMHHGRAWPEAAQHRNLFFTLNLKQHVRDLVPYGTCPLLSKGQACYRPPVILP